jgi:hypothetical protein
VEPYLSNGAAYKSAHGRHRFQLLWCPALKKTGAARKEKQLFRCAKIMVKNLHTNTKRPQNHSRFGDMTTQINHKLSIDYLKTILNERMFHIPS